MDNSIFFSMFLLFPLAITLHNIEEALWLPQWSKFAGKLRKSVSKTEFHFAVLIVTLLAYLSTGLFIMFPQEYVLKLFYFGFNGAMIFNAFFAHLGGTILLKRYCPGLITGLFLMVPFSSLILFFSISNNIISWMEIIIATVVLSALLMALVPHLEKLGKNILADYAD
ncbi:HXXEE domain-containing protein [Methanobacterium sp.]|uniref:HXXEE domain-containing protein n=1 Tax=Methanobacterium sp. TaxID=2164 RepID=UPI003D64984B